MTSPKYTILSNFAHPGVYPMMKAALPKFSEVTTHSRSHRDIFQTDEVFKTLCKTSSVWGYFMSQSIMNQHWWFEVLKDLHTNPLELKYNLNDLRFESEETPESRQGRLSGSDGLAYLYPRIDIGYGIEGYGKDNGGKGIHIDYPQRVVSILWYFSDQSEFEGGEFEFHRKRAGEFSLIDRIPIRENMAIICLQDHNAWHAVNPVTKLLADKPRIAAYIALSCSRPIWTTR